MHVQCVSNTGIKFNCIMYFVGETEKTVWVVGSSIVKNAFIMARKRPGGSNLGLPNISIWWQGYGGLGLYELEHKLKLLKKVSGSVDPDFLVIHCGANDIGRIKLHLLLEKVNNLASVIKTLFPKSVLVWSQLLLRTCWRYSKNSAAMNKACRRLNSHAAKLFVSNNDLYLRHANINSCFFQYASQRWGSFITLGQ